MQRAGISELAKVRSAFIHECYFKYLGRLGDPEGFSAFHSSELSLAEIEGSFQSSEEHKSLLRLRDDVAKKIRKRARAKNILLFGASGNGNLGDRAMPSLIASDLETRYGIGVYAYSELAYSDYDFPARGKLHLDANMASRFMNRIVLSVFDGLLIGGGGLLAFHHSPIWDPDWPYLQSCPFALLACGVADPLPHEVRNLVRHSRVASARDTLGVTALAALSPKSILCPDPILALAPTQAPSRSGQGRAFILRGPVRDAHHEIRAKLTSDDVVIGVEIAIDHPLINLFPNMSFVTSWQDLNSHVGKKELVVSERFHGVICALHAGKRTFGLTRGDHNTAKLQELFRSFGADNFCSDAFIDSEQAFPHRAAETIISSARLSYTAATDIIITELIGAHVKSPAETEAGNTSEPPCRWDSSDIKTRTE